MFKNLKRFRIKIITKNGSKEPKKVLKIVLKTHLEPFREPLKVPPVDSQRTLFSKSVRPRNLNHKFCYIVLHRAPKPYCKVRRGIPFGNSAKVIYCAIMFVCQFLLYLPYHKRKLLYRSIYL